MGGSGYYGSASGGEAMLDGVNVGLVEGDLRLRGGGFDLRAEYAQMFIFNSYRINDYLGLLGQDAISKMGRRRLRAGRLRRAAPGRRRHQAGAAVLRRLRERQSAQRHVHLQLQPADDHPPGQPAPNDPSPAQSFVHGGIVYRPLPELAFKVDLQIALDAEGPPPAPPMTIARRARDASPARSRAGAAARGMSRLGLAIGFSF